MSAARALARLEGLRLEYGALAARRKLVLLEQLAPLTFARADLLARYHEALCFCAAYPDHPQLLKVVRRALAGFSARSDLARFRDALADSGIAGTATHYNYFWMMARWLVERLPRRLALDWTMPAFSARLAAGLPLLLPCLEAEAVRRSPLEPQALIDRLRGRETDARFLLRRIAGMAGDDFTREHFHDAIDSAYVVMPGPGFPSRTLACHGRAAVAFRAMPPPAARPDLARELKRGPIDVRRVAGAEARALVELGREAMLTRARDLAAFSWGSEDDVALVDDGDGLSFALIGSLPQRRLPLPVVHGWLMLRNRVPVGYVQTDTLLSGSEISFNVFPTFRGAEAGYLFARVLSVAQHVLGARAFSIEPYQLGAGNYEGIDTGAWWFYYKLGFRPIAPGPTHVLGRELARMRRDPRHRSSRQTLLALSAGHMVFEPEAGQRAWLPMMPALGLAQRWESGPQVTGNVLRRFDVRSIVEWNVDERQALQRLAPLLLALGGVEDWTVAERRAAVDAVRAKGGQCEIEFARRVEAHTRLSKGIQRLLRAGCGAPRAG